MKVLVICLDHYPYSGACTSLLRKMFLCGSFSASNIELHVLTVKENWEEPDVEQIDSIRIFRFLPYPWVPANSILEMVGRFAVYTAAKTAFVKIAAKIAAYLARGYMLQNHIVSKVEKMIKRLDCVENYDVIASVCGYYETGAAALRFLQNKPKKLLLYQVDPCSSNLQYSGKAAKKAALLEKSLFEEADAIVTTPIMYNEIQQQYPPDILEKTVPMEFPNVTLSDSVQAGIPKTDIRCLYAGSLYSTARNPSYATYLFSRISNPKVKLFLVGQIEECLLGNICEDALGKSIFIVGKLPLDKAQKEIQNADILVNIGNIMTNQVPSKIFEYISACKPIINICANNNCPSIPYLDKYPLALSVVEGVGTPEEHAAAIEKFILENAGRTVDKAVVLDRFRECTASYCADQMSAIIHNICDGDSEENG